MVVEGTGSTSDDTDASDRQPAAASTSPLNQNGRIFL
jgi:hypothetical protein